MPDGKDRLPVETLLHMSARTACATAMTVAAFCSANPAAVFQRQVYAGSIVAASAAPVISSWLSRRFVVKPPFNS
jgi:hypothetical protein